MVLLICWKHAEEWWLVWCWCYLVFVFRRCSALFTLFCDFWLCPERSEGRNLFGLLISVVYPELEKSVKTTEECVLVLLVMLSLVWLRVFNSLPVWWKLLVAKRRRIFYVFST